MDLQTMIGQMICVGFEGTQAPETLLELIRTYKIGNIALFAHNFENKEQAQALISQLRNFIIDQTGYPPLLSVDQEGGMVTRFSKDFTHFPGAMATAATGETANARRIAYATGLEHLAVGLTADLAPVVDVNTNPNNPVIGVRSYGDTPETVTDYAMEFLAGLEDAGVLSMLKHFPGHGDTSQDSHFALPRVDKTMEELMNCELVPYIEGIKRGAPAIMTSHIVYPAIDPSGLPATMSPALMHGLLREKLGFQGIIRTDDLEMEAIREKYGIIPGALAAAKAGVDIMSISRSPHLGGELAALIAEEIESGHMDKAIVEAAFERIVRCKNKYFFTPDEKRPALSIVGCEAHRALASKISRQSIALYREGTSGLDVTGRVLVIGTNAFNQTNIRNPLLLELNMPTLLAKRLCGEGMTIAIKPTEVEMAAVMEKAAHADTVIFGTYNGHLFREQIELAHRLAKTHPHVIFVAMRNPYDLPLLPENATSLAAYEYTNVSIDTLGEIFAGNIKPCGTICVALDSVH